MSAMWVDALCVHPQSRSANFRGLSDAQRVLCYAGNAFALGDLKGQQVVKAGGLHIGHYRHRCQGITASIKEVTVTIDVGTPEGRLPDIGNLQL